MLDFTLKVATGEKLKNMLGLGQKRRIIELTVSNLIQTCLKATISIYFASMKKHSPVLLISGL